MAAAPKVPKDLSRLSDAQVEKLWNSLAQVREELRLEHKRVIAERDARIENARAADYAASLTDVERQALLQQLTADGVAGPDDAEAGA